MSLKYSAVERRQRRIAEIVNEYKTKTGKSQQRVAEELDVAQSSVSRILKANVAVSDDLLLRISKLTGVPLDSIVPSAMDTSKVRIAYLLSGAKVDKEALVSLPEITPDMFAFEVDKPNQGLRVGTLVVVSNRVKPREKDNIVLRDGDTFIYGVLEYKPELFENGWAVMEIVAKGQLKYHELNRDSEFYYVSGLHYPRSLEREFSL